MAVGKSLYDVFEIAPKLSGFLGISLCLPMWIDLWMKQDSQGRRGEFGTGDPEWASQVSP